MSLGHLDFNFSLQTLFRYFFIQVLITFTCLECLKCILLVKNVVKTGHEKVTFSEVLQFRGRSFERTNCRILTKFGRGMYFCL